jgi:hypothetical protein
MVILRACSPLLALAWLNVLTTQKTYASLWICFLRIFFAGYFFSHKIMRIKTATTHNEEQ